MKYRIKEAASCLERGLLQKNYDLIKRAGISITDNGDTSLENCEVDITTMEDLEKIMDAVNCKVVVYRDSTIMIYNDYIE